MPFWSRTWDDDAAAIDAPSEAAEPDDAALVAAARRDPAAFTALYRRYFSPIYRYCYIRLGDHATAEDATSDTFLKALTALDKYRNQSFAAWLFRIAHNTVIDAQRRKRPQAPLDAADNLLDATPTPEDAALSQLADANLQAAIATLPQEQRSVIEMQLAGWDSGQIGAVLGRSAGTIRMMRFRAFNKLREIMSKETGEDDNGNR